MYLKNNRYMKQADIIVKANGVEYGMLSDVVAVHSRALYELV